jgi:hypothetical protein
MLDSIFMTRAEIIAKRIAVLESKLVEDDASALTQIAGFHSQKGVLHSSMSARDSELAPSQMCASEAPSA